MGIHYCISYCYVFIVDTPSALSEDSTCIENNVPATQTHETFSAMNSTKPATEEGQCQATTSTTTTNTATGSIPDGTRAESCSRL